MARTFVILYGLGGSGPEHWQTWLYQQLTAYGEQVLYPPLPDKDSPQKDVWLEHLNQVLASIPAEQEITVVAHSLACILWLHHAASGPSRRVERAILVTPPGPGTNLEEVRSFFPVPADLASVQAAAASSLLVLSTTDPYCTVADAVPYMSMGIPTVVLPEMGHINVASGHGPWEWILPVCLEGKAELPFQATATGPKR